MAIYILHITIKRKSSISGEICVMPMKNYHAVNSKNRINHLMEFYAKPIDNLILFLVFLLSGNEVLP